jgi:hypothetical protein
VHTGPPHSGVWLSPVWRKELTAPMCSNAFFIATKCRRGVAAQVEFQSKIWNRFFIS